MYRKIIVVLVAVIFICTGAFAMCGMCKSDEKPAGSAKAETVKVNNTICPVTGDKVDMKNPATIDYKGETYNLCCPMCVEEFSKDPVKYSAKAKAK